MQILENRYLLWDAGCRLPLSTHVSVGKEGNTV